MRTRTALKGKHGRTALKTVRRHTPHAAKAPAPAARPLSGFHLQKILVPVDFSTCSARALEYAIAFARPAHAQIMLLHVVEPVVYPMYGQAIAADYSAVQGSLLETGHQHLTDFSRAHNAGFGPMKLLVKQGSAWGEIVDAAKKEGADLIIVSTHGHTGLRHVLLGSTAERVVRHAPCPVLIVREREREFVRVNYV